MLPSEVMRQVRRIQIRTSRMVNEFLSGQYESIFKGQGIEFKEVRSYVPGDDIRAIDWNVTARTGEPHVKVMAEERELTVMLLVDMSGSGRFGSVNRLKNELAAELCAVLAFAAIQNNDKVGLMIFTDRVELYVPPQKGRKHVLRVIREVLCHEPKGRGPISPPPSTTSTTWSAVGPSCSWCRTHGRQLRRRPAHLTTAGTTSSRPPSPDPREEELPPVGLVNLRDAETGTEVLVNTRNAAFRRAYAGAADTARRTRDERLRKARVDVMNVRTDTPYVNEIHRFFRMRERRMR
jgi:uncharacterized protein (DUF58 family)